VQRGIGFDIDHTLVIDNKLERVAFLHLLGVVIEEGGHAMGSLAEETAAIDELLKLQRSGAFSIDDAVARFVLERGVHPKPSHAEFFRATALRMVDDFVIAAPDAQSTLTELEARGYAVAIVSNGWNPLQQRKAARAGFHGRVIASGDIGVQKPDSRIFEVLAAELQLEPKAIWFVGDDPRSDVSGALGAGLRAIWLDAEGVVYPLDLPVPTERIGTLSDLLSLFAGPVSA
jgi:putative hydrolase of the HAD superfamily